MTMETMSVPNAWIDVGAADELAARPLQQVLLGRKKIALACKDGEFSAISGVCNHAGGPLGEGTLDGDYVVCPWHYWKFHCRTGEGEPGYEEDRVPAHDVRVENGRVLVDPQARTKRGRKPHAPHPLARTPQREPGPIRVLGISTTAMTAAHPRYSTSEDLLPHALHDARPRPRRARRSCCASATCSFRECEGFYSKSSRACTWPCSITQMDPNDQMDRVYEGVVHWADVILVATPIRWGGASSLYYKMVERMNCIQNQETIAGRHLLRNKVAGFIITGGQDNVQARRGPDARLLRRGRLPVPAVSLHRAHPRLERGGHGEQREVRAELRVTARRRRQAGAQRCVEMAQVMIQGSLGEGALIRGGRKGHQLESPPVTIAGAAPIADE